MKTKSMINTQFKAPIKEYRNSNFTGGDIAHTLELLSLGQHMQHATVMLQLLYLVEKILIHFWNCTIFVNLFSHLISLSLKKLLTTTSEF